MPRRFIVVRHKTVLFFVCVALLAVVGIFAQHASAMPCGFFCGCVQPGFSRDCCIPEQFGGDCGHAFSCQTVPDNQCGGGSHKECQGSQCVTVSGAGSDSCSSNANCAYSYGQSSYYRQGTYYAQSAYPPATLSVGLTAAPSSGNTPLAVTLTATVSGTATGTINYNFWWNCANATTNFATATASCGALTTPAPGSCASNANGQKCNGIAATTQTANHTYTIGSYNPKVIVERDAAPNAERRTPVTVILGGYTYGQTAYYSYGQSAYYAQSSYYSQASYVGCVPNCSSLGARQCVSSTPEQDYQVCTDADPGPLQCLQWQPGTTPAALCSANTYCRSATGQCEVLPQWQEANILRFFKNLFAR